MRLLDDERTRARKTAQALIPVIYERPTGGWLLDFERSSRELARNIVMFSLRGKHVNSLAWRSARRYGKGMTAPARAGSEGEETG